jgi:hypothetical protein
LIKWRNAEATVKHFEAIKIKEFRENGEFTYSSTAPKEIWRDTTLCKAYKEQGELEAEYRFYQTECNRLNELFVAKRMEINMMGYAERVSDYKE